MKKLFIVLSLIFTASVAFGSAGTSAVPGTKKSGNIIVTKSNKAFRLPQYTVATLPTLVASEAGAMVQITDGDSTEDCTVGSGANVVTCRWSGVAWSNNGDGAATEIEAGAFDFATWNGNTNGGTKDAIRDQFVVYDTDGDGDIDNIDGAVGGGDITGVGPAGLSAGDALTDGYATIGTTLFIFEGTSVDANQYTIAVPSDDPLASLTWTFPSVTGTLLTADGIGTALTALDGENIQDDTIDDDSLDFSDITLDDFVSAEGDYISVAADDTFDFTRNDAGTVTLTASDDDGTADLTVLPGGAAALTLGGASATTITATTDGGSITLDGLVAIGADPADQGVIRLENATIIAWEDATETTLTHVDDTGLAINTGLQIGGLLNADGVVALGDGGDNFSVASDGIDIDTSGNITNAGTISSGKVTSSGAFESATGTFDVTGAAAITVGSADVTAVTITTDNTGDGSDLVLPAQSVNGSEMLNDTVTATQLSAALTLADGDILDLGGITHTVATDEGFVLPNWANVVPTSDKKFLAADGSNLKLYNGGWVTIGASAAPTDATYLTLSNDATLSAERVMTAGYALDFTDAGANGTLTIALDTTEVSADGSDTFSDGTQASVAWTIDTNDVADNVITFTNGLTTFNDAVTVTDTLTASAGISVAAAQSISIGADPADAGALRLSNAEYIISEAAPAGTDVSVIGVTSGEVVAIGASGASGVTITPATTFSGGIADSGTISAGTWQGTAVADTYVADDITLTNITQVTNRSLDDITDGATYQKVLATDVDASGHVNIVQDSDATGAVQFTGLSVTRAITLVDAAQTLANLGSDQTFTGNMTWSGTNAFNGEITMGADFNLNANEIQSTGDVVLQLGDAAGANKFSIQDSAGVEVFNINSDGVIASAATNNPYILLDENDGTDYYIGIQDTTVDRLEFRRSATVNTSVDAYLDSDHLHVAGNLNLTTGHTYQINDTQINYANLAQGGNATPTGTWNFVSATLQNIGAGTVTSGDNYTTISNNAADDTINELFAAVNTWAAGVSAGTLITLSDVAGADYTAGTILIGDGVNSYDMKAVSGAITLASDGSTALAAASTIGTSLAIGADPADAGALRLSNAGYIFSEAAPAGTDISVIGVDSGEIIQIGASGASGVTITPTVALSTGATIPTGQSLAIAGTSYISGGADPGDTGFVRMSNNTAISWEQSTPGTDIFLALDSSDIFQVGQNAANITLGGPTKFTTSMSPTSADSGTIGTTDLEVSDIYLADGGVVYLGADQDVTLTHVADTGVLLNAAMQLQFRDSALHIASADDGHLDLTADTSIDLNGPVVATSSIAATGVITGLVNTSATPASLTNFNGSFTVSAAGSTSLTLPTAAAGYSVCIRQGQGRTDTLSVTPSTGDYIVKDGVRGTIATAISSGGAATDKACFVSVDDTDWYMDYTGTWGE